MAGLASFKLPARAAGLAATPSMRGGANNYMPGAPIVERIGGGGFWMSGTVAPGRRRRPSGGPAHPNLGAYHRRQQRDWHSHGATLTDANGAFRREMPQIVPALGQAHAHLTYDSGECETVFLRPLLSSPKDTSLEAHFVLQPA